jgi:3-isopropylmalate/(R)-2-methylmalate dehydratase small subunit
MNISKASTLTSGIIAIARDVKKNNQESLDIKIVKACSEHKEKILVADVESEKISNYDEVVKSIHDLGFGIVISDVFTDIFSAKALDYGILTVEVSRVFLEKILDVSKGIEVKLFIDLKGQELMIVNTGEKEFFEMSDYNKDSFEGGNDDAENLYDIWEDVGGMYQPDELVAYIEGSNYK